MLLKLLPAFSSDILTMEAEMSCGSIEDILDPHWLEVTAPVLIK